MLQALGRQPRARLLALVALGCLVFVPAVWSAFVSDDYILLHALREATGVTWPFGRNDVGEPGASGHFYRPLWVLWNLGIYRAFGASAVAFHLGNLLLYGVVVLEVWLLLRRLVGPSRAWLPALLFAVYPRHGESVAWVSGNTDLLAVAIGLAAILWALAGWPLPARVAGAAALTAAAVLAKEISLVLPALALLALWLRPAEERRTRWLVPGAMAAAAVAVFVVRYIVIGGLGGYPNYPWTPARVVVSAASYVLASMTPADVEAFRFTPVFLIPLALAALASYRGLVLWRRGDRDSSRIVAVGVAWFLVSLTPFLNLTVDLNNANGERLMFLATVGVAIVLAGLLPRDGVRLVAALGVTALLAASSIHTSFDWIEAGKLSGRVVRSATALGPPGGELVLLAAPENYRTAHVFTGGDLNAAVRYRDPKLDLTTAICTQVTVQHVGPNEIRFRQRSDGYEGRAAWSAPFDLPVTRSTAAITGECSYKRVGHTGLRLGLGLRVLVTPHPLRPRFVLAYFDGRDLRKCCP